MEKILKIFVFMGKNLFYGKNIKKMVKKFEIFSFFGEKLEILNFLEKKIDILSFLVEKIEIFSYLVIFYFKKCKI